MSNKRTSVAGWNNRFNDQRFAGFQGAKGANIFPYDDATEVIATDPSGTYDGTRTLPQGTVVSDIEINVTEAFEEGATIVVGTPGDPDALVTLADSIDLESTGQKFVNRETIWPSDSVVRTTIGGEELSSGRAVVTVNFSV